MTAIVKRVLRAAVATALIGFGGAAVAAPIINVSLEGRKVGTTAYSKALSVNTGDQIEYRVTVELLPPPIVNDDKSYLTAGAGDGINSVPRFDIKQLLADEVQVSFGASQLVNGWGNGAGTSAGTSTDRGPTNTSKDLVGVRAVQGTNVYVANDPLSVIEGTFTVDRLGAGGTATLGMSFNGTPAGAFRAETTNAVFISNATETDGDPFISFSGLTVTAVPEPASLSLVGLGAMALLGRRRKTA